MRVFNSEGSVLLEIRDRRLHAVNDITPAVPREKRSDEDVGLMHTVPGVTESKFQLIREERR